MTCRYFVSYDLDGTVSHLVRICKTETALWGEYYRAGQWIKDGAVMSYLSDNTVGQPISEERPWRSSTMRIDTQGMLLVHP